MPKVELTDRFCRSAKAQSGKQTDYFDTNTPGLCLRVSPGGTRTWQLHYTRPTGKRARITLGRFSDDDLTLAKARTKAREARGTVRDGGDPLAERNAKAAAMTVRDLVESYISRHADTKRSGPEIARRLRKNVADAIGETKLVDLHRRDLTRCIDAVVDRGAGVEANRVFQDLRAMVRWARARGDLDSNLAEGMKLPTETTERERALSPDELKAVWRALPEAEMWEGTRNVVRLCLVTAQRVSEVCGMTRAELDLHDGIWTIPGARTKNGLTHKVPLSALAISILREQMTTVEVLAKRKKRRIPSFVFPAPGARAAITGAAIAKAVKKSEKSAGKGTSILLGAAPWTPHDLRRTAATMMEEAGVSPHVIGHVLNHKTVTRSTITSRVYARYDYADEKRAALDAWGSAIEQLIGGKADG